MTDNLTKQEYKTFHQLSLSIASLTLNPRQLCDLELIMNGSFYPLTTFHLMTLLRFGLKWT